MAKKLSRQEGTTEAAVYQIRFKGHLGEQWVGWFGGLEITPDANGETVLTGPVVDQAALFSLLRSVRDLGLPLLSVTRLPPGQTNAGDGGEA